MSELAEIEKLDHIKETIYTDNLKIVGDGGMIERSADFMRKLNKKDSADALGLFMAMCAVAIFIYLLPYLVIGALFFGLFMLIFGDKGNDNK